MPKLILASGSPRRQHYMRQLGLPFEILVPDIDETMLPGEKPLELVTRLSGLKAAAVAGTHPDAIVVAADTVVAVDDEILGKPADRADALRMILKLRGRTHHVYTGVTIRLGDRITAFQETTAVTFGSFSDALAQHYVDSGECDDKSGSYAVQGLASVLVTRVEGSVSSVVGLPIAQVREALEEFGLNPPLIKITDSRLCMGED